MELGIYAATIVSALVFVTVILLAEDNPVNQKLAQVILKKQGFTVITVGNGQGAVHAIEHHLFDLVLMVLARSPQVEESSMQPTLLPDAGASENRHGEGGGQ